MLMQYILRSVRPRLTVVMLQKAGYSNGVGAPPKVNPAECESNRKVIEFCDYEEAIKALNTLQSNAESIRQSIINKKNQTTLDDTVKYLNRSGITLEELDKLSVIHVSGTKGKRNSMSLFQDLKEMPRVFIDRTFWEEKLVPEVV